MLASIDLMNMIIYCIIFIFGGCIGSFLNVIIYRFNKDDINIFYPPSFCTTCKVRINYYDNIPIVSYFILKGRCRHCNGLIAWRYPFVEFITAIFFLLFWLLYGYSAEFFSASLLFAALLAISYIDIDDFYIPVFGCLILAVAGLGFAIYDGSFTNKLIGGVVAFVGLFLFRELSSYFLKKLHKIKQHQSALGFGDCLLFGALGAYFGLYFLPIILLLSSIQGLLISIIHMLLNKDIFKKNLSDADQIPQSAIPFGPFLALAAIEIKSLYFLLF